jgi:subtilisin family serine protease
MENTDLETNSNPVDQNPEQQPNPITLEKKQELEEQGMFVDDNGFVVSQPFVQTLAKSRKISLNANQYGLNSTDNEGWHLLSSSSIADPFAAVAVTNNSTAFITNKTISLSANGEGVDLICMDGSVAFAKPGHPEWISEKTGLTRFQEINWPVVTGTTGTYTQPANYYTTFITGTHGTCTMSVAAGRRYGFAKEATLYSLGSHPPGLGLWDMSGGINLVRLFHINKVDKTRPTVLMLNLSVGVSLTSPNGAAVSANILGSAVTVDLSTPSGRESAQQLYSIPIFTGTESFLVTDNSTVRAALIAATSAGVIIVNSAGNQCQRIVPVGHPNYNDYFVNNSTNIYFNRGVTSSVTDVICVGAYGSDYVDGKEILASFSNKGPLIDMFAPGAAVPSASLNSSGIGSGTVLYPGSTTYYSTLFGGTSSSGPIATGVVACLAQLRPWMNCKDAKAALNEFTVKSRLYQVAPDTLNNRLAFVGAPNALLYTPLTHKSAVYI